MRVIVLGAGGGRRTEASIARAARALHHRCLLLDAVAWRRRCGPVAPAVVRRLSDAFRPDYVVLTRHAALVGEKTVSELTRGRRSALWYFDPLPPSPELAAICRLVDTTYVTYLFQIERLRAAGAARVLHLPQGMDPAVDRPAAHVPRRYRCEVSFVGSGQYPSRWAVLRAIAAACDLQVRGPGWRDAPADLPVRGGPVWGRRFAQVVGGAQISLGAHATAEQAATDAGGASNRMWKVLGCGGFYLGARVPGIERFAHDGEHCAWYGDGDHAVELARRYLADPEQRVAIAAAGRAHALARHTYAHRLALLFAGRGYSD